MGPIGHAASSVANAVTHTVTSVLNATPITKPLAKPIAMAVGAPTNLASDVLNGKNVADSVGSRGLQAVSGATYVPNKAVSAFAQTKVGQGVVGFTDSLTGGTATRALAVPELQTKVAEGGSVSRSDVFSAYKSQAIATATVGAAVLTGGAAGVGAGIISGQGIAKAFNGGGFGSALSSVGGLFGSSGVDIPGGDLFSSFGGSFLDSFTNGGGPSGPAISVNDPIGLGTGAAAHPQAPQPSSSLSTLLFLGTALAAAYYLTR